MTHTANVIEDTRQGRCLLVLVLMTLELGRGRAN
jgi:hypothetical protein